MSIDGKIQALNNAIREAIPEMRKVADDNPHAQVLVRAVKFSDGAQWHVPTETPVDSFTWTDLTASGLTEMGKALSLVADQIRMPPMTDRALPPVLVLISDGYPTDDFKSGLNAIINEPWGKKAVRIAIAIGRDADKDVLQKFINGPHSYSELKPLEANNAESLTRFIKWASTAVVKSASSPASQPSPTPASPATGIVSVPGTGVPAVAAPPSTPSVGTAATTPPSVSAVPIPTAPEPVSGGEDEDIW